MATRILKVDVTDAERGIVTVHVQVDLPTAPLHCWIETNDVNVVLQRNGATLPIPVATDAAHATKIDDIARTGFNTVFPVYDFDITRTRSGHSAKPFFLWFGIPGFPPNRFASLVVP